MLHRTLLSARTIVPRTRYVSALRTYASKPSSSSSGAGNEGRKGPLTGAAKKENPNAGRQGPLTGKSKTSQSSSSSSSSSAAPEDSSTKDADKQSKQAEKSESTMGAEASSAPKSMPGQGVEDKGGHAVPEGPGEGGKFAEQGGSALDVAGAVDKAESGSSSDTTEGREQKVDSKFWSDKK